MCLLQLVSPAEGVGHFEGKFQTEGASPTGNNHCWCQKTRVIALSCGIKISAVHCLVLSHTTRVSDRQNYDSQDRASIGASCGNISEHFSNGFIP